jgi:hypothetical protein
MKSKKTAKQIVDEVVTKVNAELPAKAEAPKTVEPDKTHYYLCNVTLDNNKPCNCAAFI